MNVTPKSQRRELIPFAKVSFNEIAFAAALFLAAAEGRLAVCSAALTAEQEQDCRLLFAAVAREPVRNSGPLIREPAERSRDAYQQADGRQSPRLFTVFRSLWTHLIVHQHRSAICARVLAFHLLMERTCGAAIDGWTTAFEGDQAVVELHPAVVEAIGQVSLLPDRVLRAEEFRQQVLRCHHSREDRGHALFAAALPTT